MIRLPSNAVGITQVEITKVELPATCYIELVTEGEGGNTSLKQIKLTQQYVTWTILILRHRVSVWVLFGGPGLIGEQQTVCLNIVRYMLSDFSNCCLPYLDQSSIMLRNLPEFQAWVACMALCQELDLEHQSRRCDHLDSADTECASRTDETCQQVRLFLSGPPDLLRRHYCSVCLYCPEDRSVGKRQRAPAKSYCRVPRAALAISALMHDHALRGVGAACRPVFAAA